MPVIQRFASCWVSINVKNHTPPHFHALFNDGREAWIAIATLAILHGRVAVRAIAEVQKARRVMQAMLKLIKLDVAKLRRAYEQA